jgi:hypothetical protein
MKKLVTSLLAMTLFAVTACGPPVPPPGGGGTPTWVPHGFTRTKSATQIEQFLDAWSSDQWYANVRYHAAIVNGAQQSSTAAVQIYPRSGNAGSVLGTPQVIALSGLSGFAPLWGESFLGVQAPTSIDFYRPVAGVWTASGALSLPSGYSPVGMTDDWVVLRKIPMDENESGELRIYALTDVAGTITPTLHTTLVPDPGWSVRLRNSFGSRVSIDGDLLALSAIGDFPADDIVRVYRATPTTWNVAFSYTDVAAAQRFSEALAIDDGATVDRLAFAYSPFGSPGRIELYTDTGAGFVPEQTVNRPAGLAGDTGSPTFGFFIGLDGDTLAVGARQNLVPVPGIASGEGLFGVVDVFRRTTSWAHETELRPWNTPSANDFDSALPWGIEVRGDHVAVTVMGSPSPGCGFLCINLGFESWVFDRTT